MIFRNEFGKTPGLLLKELRLDRATYLLQTTNRKIADIANDCGFSYPKNFTTLFRQTLALTPRQFRKTDAARIKGQDKPNDADHNQTHP